MSRETVVVVPEKGLVKFILHYGIKEKVVGIAKCNSTDEFKEDFGIALAKARAYAKRNDREIRKARDIVRAIQHAANEEIARYEKRLNRLYNESDALYDAEQTLLEGPND